MATAGGSGGGASGRGAVSGVRVGVGYVEIRPKVIKADFTKLKSGLSTDMRGLGEAMGNAIGRSLASALETSINRALTSVRTRAAEAGRNAGRQAGAEFARAFSREVTAIERNLGRLATRLEGVASRSARVFSRAYGQQVGGAIQSLGRVAERVHERVGNSAEAAAGRVGGSFRLQYTRAGAAAISAGNLARDAHQQTRDASAAATRGILADHAQVTQSARLQSRLTRQAWVQGHASAGRTAGRLLTTHLTAAYRQVTASARQTGTTVGQSIGQGATTGTRAAAPQVTGAVQTSIVRPIALGLASVGQTIAQDLGRVLRPRLASLGTQLGTQAARPFRAAWSSTLTRELLGDLRIFASAAQATITGPIVAGFAAIRSHPSVRGVVGDIRRIGSAAASVGAGIAAPFTSAFTRVRTAATGLLAPLVTAVRGHVTTAAGYITGTLIPTFGLARTFATTSSAAAGTAISTHIGAGSRAAAASTTAMAATAARAGQSVSQTASRTADTYQRSLSSAFGYVGNALTSELHRIANTATTTGQILTNTLTMPFVRATEAAVKMGATMGDELVSLQKRMLSMGIATSQSGAAIEELNDFAAKTPYTFQDMANAMPKLLDSGMGLEKSKKLLMQFSDYAASVGVTNAAKYGRALKGLTDVITMGVVKTQDMNQMSQNGVNAWQALADKMGMSIGELRQKLAKGEQISANTLIEALQPKFDRAAGAAVTASSTITGAWDNMKEKLRQTFAEMFVAMNSQGEYVYTPLGKQFQKLIGQVDHLAELSLPLFISALAKMVPIAEAVFTVADKALTWLRDAPGWVKDAVTGLTFLGPVLMAVGVATKFFAGALGLIVANPFVAVILAIGAALVIAYRNSEEFREFTGKAWNGVKDVASTTWNRYLKPTYDGVAGWWSESGRPAVAEMWSDTKDAWNRTSDAVESAWTNRIRPRFAEFSDWWAKSGRPGVAEMGPWIAGQWGGMSDAVSTAWTGHIRPAYDGIHDYTVNKVAPAVAALWNTWVQPVVNAVIPTVEALWLKVLQPTFSALTTLLTTVVVPALELLWSVTVTVFGAIGAVVSTAWGQAIWPTLKAIGDFLGEHVIPILEDLWAKFWTVFTWIGDVVTVTWQKVIAPALDALVAVLGFVVAALRVLWEIAQPILALLGWAVSVMWSLSVKPALEALWWFLRDILGPALTWLYRDIVEPVMSGIGSAISWAWTWVISPALSGLGAAIGLVGAAFTSAKDVIGEAWDKIKEKVASPVRATVQWINDKLIGPENGSGGGINKFLNWIGVSVPTIPGFAQGGIVPGYAPGKDQVPAMLAPGEGVLRPEVVRWLGSARILAWNAAAAAGRGIQKFGLGGIVGDVWDGATDVVGDVIDEIEDLTRKGVKKMVEPLVRGISGKAESWARGAGFSPWGVTVATAPLRWAVNPILDWVGGKDSSQGAASVAASNAPQYANGGLVTSPTWAMVGEEGPELVLPLNRPQRMAELLREAGLISRGGHTVNMYAAPDTPTEKQLLNALRFADMVYGSA
ncbi:tape measure protein [Yinghuangia sp. YIM S09857]|uniref:tape measure protein n=1 Tax=Yinghuangia sp. YIM S09857 TaxID=3436929 RepID=UPI003F538869